ncbi:cytochrome b5 [Entomortierella parvispora]|uniref:Cytochrome b5 n=1 Tax=Entomortierella parvispora TaxID=205924 RepID=A0A9P3LWE5_9FUNG|nr:cytochrome b5 [Entomortierella parvispora]
MSEIKTFTTADLANHSSKDSLYLAVGGKVYDCTEFIDEHPGGEEVLIDEAGKDATESFEDVGHSDEAREIMAKMYVGEFQTDGSGKQAKSASSGTPKPIPAKQNQDSGSATQILVAVAAVAGFALYKFFL